MLNGRRQLTAVHAVEKPLDEARFTTIESHDLVNGPRRRLGETFAYLAATLNVHSHSTGQIDLEAEWTDRVDRLTDPAPTDEDHTGHVHTHKPRYEESEVKFPHLRPGEFTPREEDRPKHDFGDTKHRFVKYRADSTTRYREYFPTSVTSVPENITLRGENFEHNIRSSARPDIPDLLYIVPTFKWEVDDGRDDHDHGHGHRRNRHHHQRPGETTSTRVGRGLRVYLARPWFSSGVGELLGVVIPQNPQIQPNDPTRQYISEWGADPIWSQANPFEPNRHIVPSDFANARQTTTNPVSIPEVPIPLPMGEDDPKKVPDDAPPTTVDPNLLVTVVGFDVEYNQNRRVWFSDIEFNEVESQTPFLRLCLVRYQPDSIPNAYVSGVVRAEFAQFVNDRAATIMIGRQTIRVSVSGIATQNQFGVASAGATPAPMDPTPPAPPEFEYDPAAGAGRLVIAHVERRDAGASNLEWARVGDEVVLPSFRPVGPTTDLEILWTGEVPRPHRARGPQDYRLVVREIELFQTDVDVAESFDVPIPSQMPEIHVRGRVAYLDTIALKNVEI
jgi:hypothetical protein